MSKTARVVLTLIGLMLDVASVVAWFTGSQAIEGIEGLRLGRSAYAGLFAGGLGLIVWANWRGVRLLYYRCSPRKRFHNLHYLIANHRLAIDNPLTLFDRGRYHTHFVNRMSLMNSLHALRIPTPDLDAENQVWTTFLVNLESLSSTGRLFEARSLYARISKGMELPPAPDDGSVKPQ